MYSRLRNLHKEQIMSHATLINGWERLANGFDVEFKHRIPVRLSDNGQGPILSDQILAEEVSSLGELHIEIGEWACGEKLNEHEAPLFVSHQQIKEVLYRLALSSAALFFDRYKKPIDKNDVDWDEQEYHKDFGEALEHCRLDWSDHTQIEYHDFYIDTMHKESQRLSKLDTAPFIDLE